jgi:hypothetical protein
MQMALSHAPPSCSTALAVAPSTCLSLPSDQIDHRNLAMLAAVHLDGNRLAGPCANTGDQLDLIVVKDAYGHHAVKLTHVEVVASLIVCQATSHRTSPLAI